MEIRMRAKIKIIRKPWGRETWFAHNQRYVGKIITINKGHRLSRQYHTIKHETLYVLAGRLRAEVHGRTTIIRYGGALEIRPNIVHRFGAPSGRVTLVEVSTPEVWDVVRLDDDYGRKERGRRV